MKIQKDLGAVLLALMLMTLIAAPEATNAAGIAVLPDAQTLTDAGLEPDGLDFQNGNVGLRHIPTLITYWIQLLLQIAGGLAVIMIMVGGVQYMIGSVSNDKEQGKKTITYALGGLVLAFFAWWIVELIQVWMTS